MILDVRPDLARALIRRDLHSRYLSASAHLAGGERLSHLYLCGLPGGWVADAPEQLRESCISYRKSLYQWLEEQLAAAPYALGAK